jgi:hypothetical protein
MQWLQVSLTSGERRLGMLIEVYDNVDDPRRKLVHLSTRTPAVAWTPIADLGGECVAYDECERAWIYFVRDCTFVAISGARNEPPPEGPRNTAPGSGCRAGSTDFSRNLCDSAIVLASLIDRQVAAAQLAVAAEPARRSCFGCSSAVAPAR